MTHIVTMNFSLKSKSEISLNDIFLHRSGYLNKLSAIAVEDLKLHLGKFEKHIDEKWIEEGAGPEKENFSKFVLVPGAIIFYFEQYAVTYYAAGQQEVKIPLSRIKNILNPGIILTH